MHSSATEQLVAAATHTRGIDLKLLRNYRAALTLGPNITKDKFVQGEKATLRGELSFSNSYLACMRMKKLGKGQSVVFCIPREIRFQVMSISGKSRMRDINVSDVLRWAISET